MSQEISAPLAIPESADNLLIIKTGAYIIPAGFYAHTKVLEAEDTDFTVNGVIAERRRRIVWLRESGSQVLGTHVFQLPAYGLWRVQANFVAGTNGISYCFIGSSTAVNYVGPITKTIPSNTPTASVWAKGTAFSGIGSQGVVQVDEFLLAGSYNIRAGNWITSWMVSAHLVKQGKDYESIVPEGTSLNGERYEVTLYPMIKNNLPEELKVGN